jgi:predicted amino acid dehydrogenase
MEVAYETAQTANPKLTRGQFVSANVLAKNLGDKNPAITTQAILDGLQSGKSIGQTLQGLGMKDTDADKAEKAAAREIRAANRNGGKPAKPAAKPDSTKTH